MSPSTNGIRALQRTSDNGGWLALLKMDDPSFSAPVRLVNDTRNLVTLGDTWIALPFELKLPNQVAKEAGRAQLRIDNVGRTLTAELERLAPGAALMATLMLVHRSAPGVVEWQFTAPLSNVHVDMQTFTATMGWDDVMRRSAVLLRFDPATAPGIFAD